MESGGMSLNFIRAVGGLRLEVDTVLSNPFLDLPCPLIAGTQRTYAPWPASCDSTAKQVRFRPWLAKKQAAKPFLSLSRALTATATLKSRTNPGKVTLMALDKGRTATDGIYQLSRRL